MEDVQVYLSIFFSDQQWRLQPIMVEAFPDHVKGMHRDRDEEFENEYNVCYHVMSPSLHCFNVFIPNRHLVALPNPVITLPCCLITLKRTGFRTFCHVSANKQIMMAIIFFCLYFFQMTTLVLCLQ